MFDGQPPSVRPRPIAAARRASSFELLPWLSERILEPADVKLNGPRPWDIQIHDQRALSHALLRGSVGFGSESPAGSRDRKSTAI